MGVKELEELVWGKKRKGRRRKHTGVLIPRGRERGEEGFLKGLLSGYERQKILGKRWFDVCAQCGRERRLVPAPFSNLGDPYGWCKECWKKYVKAEKQYW